MIERLSPTGRNVLLAVLGVGLVAFFWSVRSVLNPLIAAYFLAYAIHPMVLGLQRRYRFSRTAAVNTIFGLFFVGLTITLVGLGLQARRLVQNRGELADSAEASLDTWIAEHPDAVSWVLKLFDEPDEEPEDSLVPADPADGAQDQVEEPPVEDPAQRATTWRDFIEQLGEELFTGESAAEAGRVGLRAAGTGWDAIRRVFGTGFAVGTFVFLLPIYTWFLLFELGRIHTFVRRYLPSRDRERFSSIGRQIGEVVSNFFRGRLLVCLLKGLVATAGLFIAGVPYALLIGLGAGFLSLVPFVGPLFAAAVAFVVALTDHSFWYALIATGAVFCVAELVEGYILIPKILGNSLGLHPVVVLISVFVGGAAFGMFGMLLAIPVTAALVILARELVLPALAQFADEDG